MSTVQPLPSIFVTLSITYPLRVAVGYCLLGVRTRVVKVVKAFCIFLFLV